MPHYQFSAIQIVPRPGDGEPLSIGVILYDADRNVAYRKLTDNWDEVRQRTGLGSLPDLRKVTEEGPFPAKGDYLDALAESQFHDSLLVTAPKRLMDFETRNAALDWAFKAHVSLPQKVLGPNGHPNRADSILGKKIKATLFPPGCHKAGYRFTLPTPAVRLPHVFLKDDTPRAVLFAASLRSASAHGIIKQRLADVLSVRKWTGLSDLDFTMCVVQQKREIGLLKQPVRDALQLLNKWNIGVTYWNDINKKLKQILQLVSSRDIPRLAPVRA